MLTTHGEVRSALFVFQLSTSLLMDINEAYSAYSAHPTTDTITALYDSCRVYANCLTRGYLDADYLAQGAVVAAWQSLDSFDGKCKFSTWFYRVADRHIKGSYRKRIRKELVPTDQYLPGDESRLAFQVTPERPGRDARQLPLSRAHQTLVATLAATGDYQETALRLGITMKALYSRLERIKNKCCDSGENDPMNCNLTIRHTA